MLNITVNLDVKHLTGCETQLAWKCLSLFSSDDFDL